jgi:hypothetical protein
MTHNYCICDWIIDSDCNSSFAGSFLIYHLIKVMMMYVVLYLIHHCVVVQWQYLYHLHLQLMSMLLYLLLNLVAFVIQLMFVWQHHFMHFDYDFCWTVQLVYQHLSHSVDSYNQLVSLQMLLVVIYVIVHDSHRMFDVFVQVHHIMRQLALIDVQLQIIVVDVIVKYYFDSQFHCCHYHHLLDVQTLHDVVYW